MRNFTDTIIDVFPRMEKKINLIAKTESLAVSSSFSTINSYSHELLKNKSADCKKRLTDKILETNFIAELLPNINFSDEQMKLIKYNSRQLSAQLVIPFPIPLKQLRNLALPILAFSGTVIGMFFSGFLFRVLLGNDYRPFGIIVGAAVGAFLFTLLGIYLSKREFLTRIFQGLFGAAIAAEIFTLFTGSVNPVSILWRKLTGRFGGGLLGKIKRICAFVIGILILQITVPEEKVPQKQLLENSYSAIKSWLEQSLKLLILIIIEATNSFEKENNNKPEKIDVQLLQTLAKLTGCQDAKEIEFTSGEIVPAFKNAGYEVKSKEMKEHLVFSAILKNEFDVEGYINEGDEYKIFEMPLYKNDKLIIRGKLTKKR